MARGGNQALLKNMDVFPDSSASRVPALTVKQQIGNKLKQVGETGARRNPQPVIEAVCACDTHAGWLRCTGVRMNGHTDFPSL